MDKDITVITSQTIYDPYVRRWTGRFFRPVVGGQYMVPKNASNHPEYRGYAGTCKAVRSNTFGHHWAYLYFDSLNNGVPKLAWIRTNVIIPVGR